ncbi:MULTISPECIES: cytochrome bc1 complex Rieske iron-sulfur subunit [unclassified Streptomyces]|uniref:cytochrome bc1 complex Rieske iron-sulfur subunit n=1 Tax=unclassified Streptomyces TaxID=2593676 RepID=UPI0022B745DD|nr:MULTISPECIES: Rieske 2Fe-2S domain-containing protein [unclassified Streptomyces]MCZ7413858.1 Rieske 2Fe-2S domain-containing protein [Streptomyces sp. WMMC897]MCZ7430854.1 Rieske 2Fe-2S domain-containing protein [Streptomyces sp. WMMC1477]
MSSETGPHENVSDDKNLPSARDPHGAETEPAHTNPFADPGLPPHDERIQDIDERAAKRSERTVALLFTLSMLATVGFIVSYAMIPVDKLVYIFPLGHINALNFALGTTLGVALFAIGAATVHWSRTLMSGAEIVQDRYPIGADDTVKQSALADLAVGVKDSQFGRRRLLRNTMFGALALVPLSGVVLLGSLGPAPGTKLRHTAWQRGKRLVNENTSEPLRPEDITVGSLTFAMPEGLEHDSHEFQREIAKAALMLVRLEPEDIKDQQELEWSYEGVVAYSKICTHVGCPVSLYEQQTHHVLCPCHQSTFDLADGARVIFGPAGHPLPQLRIGVDDEGFLTALDDFAEPVGPSFWERG